MSPADSDRLVEINQKFKQFIDQDVIAIDYPELDSNGELVDPTSIIPDYSKGDLEGLSLNDWYDRRSLRIRHNQIFGSNEEMRKEATFLLYGLSIFATKVKSKLNKSIEDKKIKQLQAFQEELKNNNQTDYIFNHIQNDRKYINDFKKSFGAVNITNNNVEVKRLIDRFKGYLEEYIEVIREIDSKELKKIGRTNKKEISILVEKKYLDRKEAAVYCGLSYETIKNDQKSGKLVADGGNRYRGWKFTKVTLDAYIANRK